MRCDAPSTWGEADVPQVGVKVSPEQSLGLAAHLEHPVPVTACRVGISPTALRHHMLHPDR